MAGTGLGLKCLHLLGLFLVVTNGSQNFRQDMHIPSLRKKMAGKGQKVFCHWFQLMTSLYILSKKLLATTKNPIERKIFLNEENSLHTSSEAGKFQY